MMWQGEQLPATFNPHATPGHVLCCLCGVIIQPNATNMCINCLRTQVDISDGIQKQVTVLYCKECGSYLQPPKHWVRAELESKELLTFCLKRVRGLQKVKLVDAGFIWTEPHSKRLKVKLTIQKEVMNGAILQQTFVVEFVVESNLCPNCARVAANPDTWKANVQVRQHVEHKRTFMYLEQVILKHGAQEQCVNIKDIHEGIDFYFGNRSHASKFVDFLQAVVPVRFRHDKQLVSHDEKNGSYNYRYTFSVEIAPICRDDLICLPQKISSSMGGFGPLVLCLRVTNAIVLIDPVSLRTTHLDAKAYWATGLKSMQSSRQLKRFVVLDIEPVRGLPAGERGQSKRHQLAEVQLARESDLGSNNTLLYARTHLGSILQAGDLVLGYDLATSNLVDPELERYEQRGYQVPDVVLVRKSYEDRRARRRRNGQRRHWKLRSLGMELDGGEDVASSHLPPQQLQVQQGAGRRGRGEHGLQRMAEDRERFLEELEEDPEMRKNVAIYKDASAMATTAGRPGGEMDDSSDDDGEVPEIPLEELLDGLEALQLEQDSPPDGGGGDDSAGNMMES